MGGVGRGRGREVGGRWGWREVVQEGAWCLRSVAFEPFIINSCSTKSMCSGTKGKVTRSLSACSTICGARPKRATQRASTKRAIISHRSEGEHACCTEPDQPSRGSALAARSVRRGKMCGEEEREREEGAGVCGAQ